MDRKTLEYMDNRVNKAKDLMERIEMLHKRKEQSFYVDEII